jgi:hypothetical protein
LNVNNSASSISKAATETPIHSAANTTSRMIFRKLETEPGPRARKPSLHKGAQGRARPAL